MSPVGNEMSNSKNPGSKKLAQPHFSAAQAIKRYRDKCLEELQQKDAFASRFPSSRRDETWKYFPISRVKTEMQETLKSMSSKKVPDELTEHGARGSHVVGNNDEQLIEKCNPEIFADAKQAYAAKILFVNGRLAYFGCSDKDSLDCFKIESAGPWFDESNFSSEKNAANAEYSHVIEAWNHSRQQWSNDIFSLYRDAFAQQSEIISITQSPTKPIFIKNIYTGAANEEDIEWSVPCSVFIHVSEGVQAEFLEEIHASGPKQIINTAEQGENKASRQLINYGLGIALRESAKVVYSQAIQSGEGVFLNAEERISLRRNSQLEKNMLVTARDMSRVRTLVSLGEEAASSKINCAYLTHKNAVSECSIDVSHNAKNCKSQQNYRSVTESFGQSIFKGNINVRPGCSGTDAQMNNKNILLDENAQVFTKPELNIDNDDVRCSHGATVSMFEKEWLHYLKARGIKKQAAENLILRSFINALWNEKAFPKMHDPVVDILSTKNSEI